jgi:hypothetical protein
MEMSERLIVIGLCGEARSGKDTVAQHLVHEFGFTRIGLADGVRSAFADIDGPTWEARKELEAAGKTNRWAAQTLGTECREFVGCDTHWIDHALIKINYLARQHPVARTRFVIPDIRFGFEAENFTDVIGAWNGKFACWRITRPGSGLTGDAAKHSSETGVSDVRCTERISNDSSIQVLRMYVSELAKELLGINGEDE